MDVAEFDFHVPEDLVAQHPSPRREESRMLVLGRDEIRHLHFSDIVEFFAPGDVLVVNDTRVFPARLRGCTRTGGSVEVLLSERTGPRCWRALAKPSRRFRPGDRFSFGEGVEAEVVESAPAGEREILFSEELSAALLARIGEVPLPPYIERESGPGGEDLERYQTVYAAADGAVAAPTAGLHFTPEILEAIRGRGTEVVPLTLHVSWGTFRPMRTERVEDHRMDAEAFSIPEKTADAVSRALAEGRRVTAVGTTVVRTLEARFSEGRVLPGDGRTDLFVYPGFRFRVVGRLLTNFHFPRSSLILLVCAFGGKERVLAAYREAVKERYRFFSYGDCMLLER